MHGIHGIWTGKLLEPEYIDVSSGIEYNLGKKSTELMAKFILNTKN